MPMGLGNVFFVTGVRCIGILFQDILLLGTLAWLKNIVHYTEAVVSEGFVLSR